MHIASDQFHTYQRPVTQPRLFIGQVVSARVSKALAGLFGASKASQLDGIRTHAQVARRRF